MEQNDADRPTHQGNAMTPHSDGTTQLLHRMRAGDMLARNALIAHARQRLLALTSYMLRQFPEVRRFEETDDVMQNALMRLARALTDEELPHTSAHYWNLARVQIRRELLDLARHYCGTYGLATNQNSDPNFAADDPGGALHGLADPSSEPRTLEAWTHFHEAIGNLPEEEQQAFGLIWYMGMTQNEAAQELDVSLSTIGRRWRNALLRLDKALRGEPLP
jgi:RNA polymerase sigma factor (sigma-70 family)